MRGQWCDKSYTRFHACIQADFYACTGGDAHLGGDDWDMALQQWVLAQQPPGLQPRCGMALALFLRSMPIVT